MKKKVINIDPKILSGTPVFFGTRVPIKNLFDYIKTGESLQAFLEDFPTVKKEQVMALLEIASQLLNTTTTTLYENIT